MPADISQVEDAIRGKQRHAPRKLVVLDIEVGSSVMGCAPCASVVTVVFHERRRLDAHANIRLMPAGRPLMA